MILVPVTEPVECSRVVANNHRVHAFGDGHLPGIVLAHPLRRPALSKCYTLGVLVPDGLPAECAEYFTHRSDIRRSFEHLGRGHRRNPKLGTRIAGSPYASWATLVRGDLIEEVDDERGIEEKTTHLRGVMRSR